MRKIVICPDSFKGTLSSIEIANTVAEAFMSVSDSFKTECVAVADGGEGTVEALGAEKIILDVTGPHFNKIHSFYGILKDTAVIELAAAAGLPMTEPLNPMVTTTYGAGELIKDALDKGIRKFIVALGGSSTNDCGCGIAAALGVKFYNCRGESFVPTGGTLIDVEKIDMSCLDERIGQSSFCSMCDITNPLCGEKGAAYVFGPQKGADENTVLLLDRGLRHLSDIIRRQMGIDISELCGAGAAGGCGGGLFAFLNSELKKGIDVLLDAADFDSLIRDADLVITGEGKFDSQSVDGKAVSGIAMRAKKANVPVVVLAGAADEPSDIGKYGITAVFSIQRRALPLEKALPLNREYTYKTARNIAFLLDKFMK